MRVRHHYYSLYNNFKKFFFKCITISSCLAFAAVSILESNIALKQNKTLPNLSEQQLVDCNRPPNHGCSGGDHYWGIYHYINSFKIRLIY